MTHQQITDAIKALESDRQKLSEVIFYSHKVIPKKNRPIDYVQTGKKVSKEDALTDLIAYRMKAAHPNLKLSLRRGTKTSNLRPDLISIDANGISHALEAKHYSSGQDSQFYKNVEGPIKDSLKLKNLKFESHFILQYTSELVEITGNVIHNPKSKLPDDIGFLRYYFNENGFISNKIPAKPSGRYLQVLTNVFSNVFGQLVEPITLEVSKKIDERSSATFKIHFFLMEINWSSELEKRYASILKDRNVAAFM